MDSLKDPIFAGIIGMEFQPMAKLFSVITTLIVVCLYDYLTSIIPKIYLFHVVSFCFGVGFFVLASYLADPVVGLGNLNRNSNRMLGWICYFVIEAYGSLMVALFWSFTNTIMDLEQAKGAYGLIISVAQFGAVIGSACATNASRVGIPKLMVLSSLNVLSVSLLMKLYSLIFRDVKTQIRIRTATGGSFDDGINIPMMLPIDPSSSSKSAKVYSYINKSVTRCSNTVHKVCNGFYDGLHLIIKYPYVLCILGTSTIDEIIVVLLDYQFKLMGSHSTRSQPELVQESLLSGVQDSSRFAHLLGNFGIVTNIISFFFAFFGFSYLVNTFKVRYALLILPMTIFVAVIVTNLVPNLWVYFVFLSIIKSLLFSLHDPVKELLYMQTSEAVKFKAAAWIDVFGCRFAKALGSLLANFAHGDLKKLHVLVEIPCIIISLLFIGISYVTGEKFEYLTNNKIIIGQDEKVNTYVRK